MPLDKSKIYIGPAGWSYPDWKGVFYPLKKERRFDELTFISRYFNLVEINSTYYHPCSANAAKGWLEKVRGTNNFQFTAKIWQKFVLERSQFTQEDVKAVQVGMDVLQEAGKLGALLVQFPQSFHNTIESRSWLFRILNLFKMFPLVVEVRHASWNTEQTFQMLEELGAGFANIDQPVIGEALTMTEQTGPKSSYFRFHGRNYENWFRDEAGRDARYDYTYTLNEQQEFSKAIKRAQVNSEFVYVVYNNHYRSQALRNAFELQYQLFDEKQNIPDLLVKAYPELLKIQQPSNPSQMELF